MHGLCGLGCVLLTRRALYLSQFTSFFVLRAVPYVRVRMFQTIKGVEAVATPSTLFYAENAAILPLWLGMIIWPEKPITKAVMSSYATVIVAALLYVWLTYEALQVQTRLTNVHIAIVEYTLPLGVVYRVSPLIPRCEWPVRNRAVLNCKVSPDSTRLI